MQLTRHAADFMLLSLASLCHAQVTVWPGDPSELNHDRGISAAFVEVNSVPALLPGGALDSPIGPRGEVATSLWNFRVFGSGVGTSGVVIGDLNGDGLNEVVVGAGDPPSSLNNRWYVLTPRPSGYEITYRSPVYPSGVQQLKLADIGNDGDVELIVSSGTNIFVHDGATLAVVREYAGSGAPFRSLEIVDVDGDGGQEFVLSFASGVRIYDVATGRAEYQSSLYGGWDIAVGNVDSDSDMEIVISNNGGTARVLNGRTRAVEWTVQSGFGHLVRAGDVDGDGLDEIVCVGQFGVLRVIDADTRTTRFELQAGDVNELELFDVNGDGIPDIVYGGLLAPEVRAREGTAGNLLWEFRHEAFGVNGLAIGDGDNDGVLEVAFGTDVSTGEADALQVHTIGSGVLEWRSSVAAGPFVGLAFGDIDSDRRPEVIAGGRGPSEGAGDCSYFIVDASSGTLEYQSEGVGVPYGQGILAVASANVDADHSPEILLCASGSVRSEIRCVDGATRDTQWVVDSPGGIDFVSMLIEDVDADGNLEVIAGESRRGFPFMRVSLRVLDAETGVEEWRSPEFDSTWTGLEILRIANLDSDPQLEIVAANWGGRLAIFDGATRQLLLTTADIDVTVVALADRDQDGATDVTVGRTFGEVCGIDIETGEMTPVLFQVGLFPRALEVGQFAGGPGADYAYAVDDALFVRYDDGGVQTWTSGPIGAVVGGGGSMLVRDVDWDGSLEIVVNAGVQGFGAFRLESSFCPGDLNGDRACTLDDLCVVLANFGSDSAYYQLGDLDRDGIITLADLATLLANFGTTCTS